MTGGEKEGRKNAKGPNTNATTNGIRQFSSKVLTEIIELHLNWAWWSVFEKIACALHCISSSTSPIPLPYYIHNAPPGPKSLTSLSSTGCTCVCRRHFDFSKFPGLSSKQRSAETSNLRQTAFHAVTCQYIASFNSPARPQACLAYLLFGFRHKPVHVEHAIQVVILMLEDASLPVTKLLGKLLSFSILKRHLDGQRAFNLRKDHARE